jgi:hypothetical protein
VNSDLERRDWRELSEAASREQDPQKLMELIRALNEALERREREQKNGDFAASNRGYTWIRRVHGHKLVV